MSRPELIQDVENKIDKTQIKNILTETTIGNVLDASQGKVLNDKIEQLETTRGYLKSKFLNSSVDLNTVIDNGVYGIQNNPNVPSGDPYGTLFVTNRNDGVNSRVSQLFIGNSKPQTIMYFRSYSATGWSKWEQSFTYNEINSKFKDWKIYDSVANIGLKSGSCTTLQVFEAMPSKTILITGDTITDGVSQGTYMFVRHSDYRAYAQVQHRNGAKSVVTYRIEEGIEGGWKQLATTQKINTLNMLNGWILYQSRGNYTITGKTVTVNAMVKGGVGASGTTIMNGLPTSAQVVPFLCFDIETGTVLHACVTGTSLQVYYNSPSWEGKTVAISVSYNIN